MSTTLRQSSIRNHRKGFKVKHVLQTCLLLAVCIWLLYQVKQYHDKKKAFDANSSKVSYNADSADENLKFGRKDLNHGARVTSENDRHGGEEETDEGGKQRTNIDQERGDEDEIDENDQEKVEEAAEHKQQLSVFAKGARGQENEERGEKNSQSESLGSSVNSQEAREEHYTGDNASSDVGKNNEMIKSEVDDRLRNSIEQMNNMEESNVGSAQKTNKTGDGAADQEGSKSAVDGETVIDNPAIMKADEKDDESGIHEPTSNVSQAEPINQVNSTVADSDASGLHSQINSISNSTSDHNATVDVGSSGENLNSEPSGLELGKNSNATSPEVALKLTKQSDADTQLGESPNARSQQQTAAAEQIGKSNKASETESNQPSLIDVATDKPPNVTSNQATVKEESLESELQKGEESSAAAGVDSSDESLALGDNSAAGLGGSVDSSSSLVIQEERDAVTDLGTLPHFETEGGNADDAAAAE